MPKNSSNSHQYNANRVGWNFPPTGGGVQDGLNNPGVAHFKGNRLHHLAREILQNSLDARNNPDEPVYVTFEVKNLNRKLVPGIEELVDHIDLCIEKCRADQNPSAENELKQAKSILSGEEITFLKVYDSNTTGLRGVNWDALIKGSGTSIKTDDTAGGSHGIGKNAAFVMSPVRTVYYWSAFEAQDSSEPLIEKFQGKSILMCHHKDGKERQGTGFWGKSDECKELDPKPELNQFRILDQFKNSKQGTAIWIAGFEGEPGWQKQIASHVIENFFFAIERNHLNIILEPDDQNIELLEINANNLDQMLDELEEFDIEEYAQIAEYTRIYLNLIREEPAAVIEDEDLGTCKFWIALEDSYPRHVALIRNTGMLITTEQKQITRFRNVHNFMAICLFEGAEGNKLLRRMENPQHDQFSADFLPNNEREQGSEVLSRITTWIRNSVNQHATKKKSKGKSEQLTELSRYLPLAHSDGPLDLEGNAEKAFGKYGNVTTRPIKIKAYPSPNIVSGESDDDEDDSSLPGGGKGGGTGSNGNDSGGSSGTPSDDGDIDVWEDFKIADVRVLENRRIEGVYRVSFIPRDNGTIKLQFFIAGDQNPEVRGTIQAASISENGELNLSPLSTYEVQENTRFAIEIYDDSPYLNSAWIVQATKKTPK